MVLQILSHIPMWVIAIFLFGLYRGISSMRERTVSLVALAIMPAVFLVLSLTSVVAAAHAVPLSVPVWLAGIGLGVLAGFTILGMKTIDGTSGGARVRVAGSPAMLILFILIFATKFYYGAHVAMDPASAGRLAFVGPVLGLSGTSTGIMIGRVVKLFVGYFRRGVFAGTSEV